MSQIGHLLHLSLLFLLSFHVAAQQQMNESSTSADGGIGNFQPSLAVVIGILSLMFSLTFILLLYAKFCQRRASAHVDPENPPALLRSRSRFSGIDKTVIESLPFFRFSSLKGSKEGLECAVCLSKFEDIEILRLLPKCKHAFHIDCIDHWLERHSSCPLCRRKVSSDDPTMLTYSNSLRLLTMNQSENGEEPNIEIFVQREEDQSHGGSSSSRFRIGSSFRKSGKGIIIKEEELPINEEEETEHDGGGGGKLYHKQNHKINISDVVFKHRWSNVSSSDLMFLNSEMINSVQSKRFNLSEPNGDEKIRASTSAENGQIFNIKEEMERKISFETKVGALNSVLDTSDCVGTSSSSGHTSKYVNPGDKRSMSEITGASRFRDLGMRDRVLKDSSVISSDVKEERRRQLWVPIARRTVQWFVNRERSQPLNVSFFHQ